MNREEQEKYATALEAAIYNVHELFWYSVDTSGRLVPDSFIDDEKTIFDRVRKCMEIVEIGTGVPCDFRSKKRVDRRLVYALTVIVTGTFLIDVVLNDVLATYKDQIAAILSSLIGA